MHAASPFLSMCPAHLQAPDVGKVCRDLLRLLLELLLPECHVGLQLCQPGLHVGIPCPARSRPVHELHPLALHELQLLLDLEQVPLQTEKGGGGLGTRRGSIRGSAAAGHTRRSWTSCSVLPRCSSRRRAPSSSARRDSPSAAASCSRALSSRICASSASTAWALPDRR